MKLILTQEESDDLIKFLKSDPYKWGKIRHADYTRIKSLQLSNKGFNPNIPDEDVMLITGDHLIYGEIMGGTHYVYSKMDSYKIVYDWFITEYRNRQINNIL